jgi:hypothetical protein
VTRAERIWVILATLVCSIFVFSLSDSGPKRVTSFRAPLPPVPASVTDRPGKITVSVEDDTGAPVAGASIRVLSISDDRAYLAGAGRSDVGGHATIGALPEGEAWVLVDAEGRARASSRLVVSEAVREVKLRMRRAETLRVTVVDDAGAAIPEASVEARTGDPLPFLAKTDDQGHGILTRIGPPPWMLKVRANGFEAASQTLSKSSADPVKVTLRRLGWIDVTTVDSEGRPIDKATVLVAGSGLWPARKTQTDEQGHAKVADLPRGIYDFRATRGDLVSPAEMGVMLGRGESKSITLTLALGRRVAVRVTDGDDETAPPVPGTSLVLAEGGLSSFPLEATTDARGAASLGPIAAGDAFLSARADGFVPKTGVAVPPGASPSVRIGLVRGGALVGDVVDARGFPVDGASIEVVGTTNTGEPIDESPQLVAFRSAHFSWALTGPRDLVPAGELGVMHGPIPSIPHAGAMPAGLLRGHGSAAPPEPWVTRNDGAFRAFPIPPGRVRAIVHHPSYLEGISDVVKLTSGGEATVHVTLHGGGTLEGRVFDDRHTPLGSVRVDIAAAKGSLERTTFTASDGTFAFAAAPTEMVVSVCRPDAIDEVALRTNVTLSEGEHKEIELVLPAVREAVSVVVTDDRRNPVDGAQVLLQSLSPDAPLRRTLFTDREGRAVFKDAAGLPVRVSVSHRGRAPTILDVDAASSEVRVELAGGIALTGSVTTRRGRDPLEGAEVTLIGAAGALHARSNRDGAFRFDDVAPGSLRLSVAHAGYAKLEQPVRIDAPTHADRPAELPAVNLEEGGSVEGEVVDARGDPVSGARVAEGAVPTYLPSGRLPPGVVLTNARGEFKIDDLRTGDVILEAYAPDVGRGRATSIRVEPGRTTSRVRITMARGESHATDNPSTGGVAISLDDGAAGVTISGVTAGSEAERAGLAVGDRILSVDGQAVGNSKEAQNRLFGPVADDVLVELSRGDTKRKLRVMREQVHR